jgi:hypothetical protein
MDDDDDEMKLTCSVRLCTHKRQVQVQIKTDHFHGNIHSLCLKQCSELKHYSPHSFSPNKHKTHSEYASPSLSSTFALFSTQSLWYFISSHKYIRC